SPAGIIACPACHGATGGYADLVWAGLRLGRLACSRCDRCGDSGGDVVPDRKCADDLVVQRFHRARLLCADEPRCAEVTPRKEDVSSVGGRVWIAVMPRTGLLGRAGDLAGGARTSGDRSAL